MVAATFDKARFNCADCRAEEEKGRDLKVEHSGQPRSCGGPKVYAFHRKLLPQPIVWNGCPRLSVDARTSAWLRLHGRTEGRMTHSEALAAPHLLLEVLDAIDFADALKSREQYENAKKEAASFQPGG